ncbi:hypothetical protein F4778DRAFT_717258 [Xylariomycetidae sp. FL2044]|nr:hypothetical protein F4778DRAFT_717258 [Xylariomycetidae sp. FL2044]
MSLLQSSILPLSVMFRCQLRRSLFFPMPVNTIPHGLAKSARGLSTEASNPSQDAHKHSHKRRNEHRPQIHTSEEDHYVVTLLTDEEHHQAISNLRRKYFPPKLLKVSAHISLFRALPGSMLSTFKQDIDSVASRTPPFTIRADKPFRMSRGIGLAVEGLETVEKIFQELQGKWHNVLSQQDRAKFLGHYTLMNKVNDQGVISRSLEELAVDFPGSSGKALGLSLWRYDRGWWRHDQDFAFAGDRRS